MEYFSQYAHALASAAGFAVLMCTLTFFSPVVRSGENRSASGLVKYDYNDPMYRRSRAHMNAVEIAGPFGLALMAAILLGANPFWVNLFASVFLLARIAMALVHIMTVNKLMRSITWLISFLCVVALAVLAQLAVW